MPTPSFHILSEAARLEMAADARHWERLIAAGYDGSIVAKPRRASQPIAAARRIVGSALIRTGGRIRGAGASESTGSTSPTAPSPAR